MNRLRALLASSIVLLASCSPAGTASVQPAAGSMPLSAHGSSPIQHVIVVVQDSRTFENLFAGYPKADAPTYGSTLGGKRVPLSPISFQSGSKCTTSSLSSFSTAYDNGKMDGFSPCAYVSVARRETAAYWDLAKQYTLADHTFASTHAGDFVNHLYLISGTTRISQEEYVTGTPDNFPWGCDAPAGTTVPVTTPGGVANAGLFPCFTQFNSIAHTLDAANVTWKFYTAGSTEFSGEIWNSFDAINDVRHGPDWERNIASPNTRVFSDLRNGTLADVSWVIPSIADSDAPSARSATGPAWVTSIVDAAKASSYWPHLAVIVIWANGGDQAFYDNVPPPQVPGVLGLGLRVPMLVISPYAKRNYVSHTTYESGGTTLRFIEQVFGLPTLGTPASGATDARANSMLDCFTF